MTGLRAGKAERLPRGVVALDYTLNDRPATVRLDNYVVKEQSAIVAAICEKKGFDDPRQRAKRKSTPDGGAT